MQSGINRHITETLLRKVLTIWVVVTCTCCGCSLHHNQPILLNWALLLIALGTFRKGRSLYLTNNAFTITSLLLAYFLRVRRVDWELVHIVSWGIDHSCTMLSLDVVRLIVIIINNHLRHFRRRVAFVVWLARYNYFILFSSRTTTVTKFTRYTSIVLRSSPSVSFCTIRGGLLFIIIRNWIDTYVRWYCRSVIGFMLASTIDKFFNEPRCLRTWRSRSTLNIDVLI